MSALPTAVVILALVSMTMSAGIGLGRARMMRAFDLLAPRPRTWWLFGALSAPLVCGFVLVALSLGHCVGHRLMGQPDDCVGVSGDGCSFCVFGSAHTAPRVWFLMGLVLIPLGVRLARFGRAWWHLRLAEQRLRSLATPRADGAWSVPGSGAFVLGWFEPVVCVGETLTQSLDASAVAAVTAHEEAHRSAGDTMLRAVARLLASAHFPSVARSLLEAFDLAIEQACDERASHHVADRLVVAQALIDTAKLQASEDASWCAPASLPDRVASLCAPPRSSATPRWAPVFGVALAGTLAAAVLMDHHLHFAVEQLSLVFAH